VMTLNSSPYKIKTGLRQSLVSQIFIDHTSTFCV
jgi:hypothetical protein